MRPLVSSADHHTGSGWVKMFMKHHETITRHLGLNCPHQSRRWRLDLSRETWSARKSCNFCGLYMRPDLHGSRRWMVSNPWKSKGLQVIQQSKDFIRLLSNLKVSFSNFSVSATGYQKCSGPVTWASCKVQFSLYPDRVSPASAVQSCVRWTLPRAFPADSRIAAHAHSSHWSSKEASTPPAVLAHRFEPSYIDNMEV